MSDGSRNFSLRLSVDDPTRLEQVAARFALDRTGALRLLIRRATIGLARDGRFTTIERGQAGRAFPVRLIERSDNDRL